MFIYTTLVIVQDMEDNTLLLIQNTGKGSVTLAVITTLFITARFISLLRGFDRTGWLVAVLIQNFLDVRGFIVVIVSILFGFTVAFRLLFAGVEGECIVNLDESNVLHNECDDPSFGTLGRSLLSTIELTISGDTNLLLSLNQIRSAFLIATRFILVVVLNTSMNSGYGTLLDDVSCIVFWGNTCTSTP